MKPSTIRQLRKSRNMTVKEFVEIFPKENKPHISTIHRWENGSQIPKGEKLKHLKELVKSEFPKKTSLKKEEITIDEKIFAHQMKESRLRLGMSLQDYQIKLVHHIQLCIDGKRV